MPVIPCMTLPTSIRPRKSQGTTRASLARSRAENAQADAFEVNGGQMILDMRIVEQPCPKKQRVSHEGVSHEATLPKRAYVTESGREPPRLESRQGRYLRVRCHHWYER